MIQGVSVRPLKQISDERGKVMHMLNINTPSYSQFGEVYFSCIHPGAIKAWKLHKEMIMNCAVPHGNIKFVLYDNREGSLTQGNFLEIFCGPDQYQLITVPAMIWTGFQCIGDKTAILANCASIPHNPDESIRLPFDDTSIPYHWNK